MKTPQTLVVLAGLAAAVACDEAPRAHQADAVLKANFAQHRAAFERLVVLAESDRRFRRVADDWVSVNDMTNEDAKRLMPAERWNEFRRLFREADVPEGMSQCDGLGRCQRPLLFLSSSEGMLDAGSLKGYAFSREPLEPLVESLDDPRQLHFSPDGDSEERFVRLDEHWYLILQVG